MGLKDCSVNTDRDSIVIVCTPESTAYESEVEYEAELLDSANGVTRSLTAPRPNFKFEGVRVNAVYSVTVAVSQSNTKTGSGSQKSVQFNQALNNV